MKRITTEERIVNIFTKAIAFGFSFNMQESLEDNIFDAERCLIDNADVIEEKCEVRSTGRSQHVGWGDMMGFEIQSDGEIIDWSSHRFDAPGTKIFHTTVVDSLGQVVKLYDTTE